MQSWREFPQMPKYALAIRHVHFEDCGSLTEVLLDHNFGIGRAGRQWPTSVYSHASHSWRL